MRALAVLCVSPGQVVPRVSGVCGAPGRTTLLDITNHPGTHLEAVCLFLVEKRMTRSGTGSGAASSSSGSNNGAPTMPSPGGTPAAKCRPPRTLAAAALQGADDGCPPGTATALGGSEGQRRVSGRRLPLQSMPEANQMDASVHGGVATAVKTQSLPSSATAADPPPSKEEDSIRMKLKNPDNKKAWKKTVGGDSSGSSTSPPTGEPTAADTMPIPTTTALQRIPWTGIETLSVLYFTFLYEKKKPIAAFVEAWTGVKTDMRKRLNAGYVIKMMRFLQEHLLLSVRVLRHKWLVHHHREFAIAPDPLHVEILGEQGAKDGFHVGAEETNYAATWKQAITEALPESTQDRDRHIADLCRSMMIRELQMQTILLLELLRSLHNAESAVRSTFQKQKCDRKETARRLQLDLEDLVDCLCIQFASLPDPACLSTPTAFRTWMSAAIFLPEKSFLESVLQHPRYEKTLPSLAKSLQGKFTVSFFSPIKPSSATMTSAAGGGAPPVFPAHKRRRMSNASSVQSTATLTGSSSCVPDPLALRLSSQSSRAGGALCSQRSSSSQISLPKTAVLFYTTQTSSTSATAMATRSKTNKMPASAKNGVAVDKRTPSNKSLSLLQSFRVVAGEQREENSRSKSTASTVEPPPNSVAVHPATFYKKPKKKAPAGSSGAKRKSLLRDTAHQDKLGPTAKEEILVMETPQRPSLSRRTGSGGTASRKISVSSFVLQEEMVLDTPDAQRTQR